MLEKVFNAPSPTPQLLGVIILNLRTVFNNEILVQNILLCSVLPFGFFPQALLEAGNGSFPLGGTGAKQHLNWRDTPGPCQG